MSGSPQPRERSRGMIGETAAKGRAMTEAEWLAAVDPIPMLTHLGVEKSSRKARLFAVACCRRIGDAVTRKGARAVDAAERFADGLIDEGTLHHECFNGNTPRDEARSYAARATRAASLPPGFARNAGYPPDYDGTVEAAVSAVNARAHRERHDPDEARRDEESTQAALLRDVFGNPFRPVAVDPAWRTSTVLAFARQMYESRDFAVMPVLADALQDAGCDHTDVLAHCRGDGPHVRGCWVVDMILGR